MINLSCVIFKCAKCSIYSRNVYFYSCLRSFDWPKEKPSSYPKVYNAEDGEKGWYEWWEKNDFFKPSKSGEKCNYPPFAIVLPPPNVTGTLHLGHALTVTIQDVIARWHRMKGSEVVWVPGLDHAGIATQVVVEKRLKKEKNLSRQDLGREAFLNEIWKWKNDKGETINKQLKKLGASLDWSKENFTLDQKHIDAANEALVRLWDAGLLYRELALVNWSCALQSAISDIEVETREINGPTSIDVPGYEKSVEFGLLTDFAYKCLNSDEEIVVSTTRVETLMGDVAVAVHPSDPKYKSLHGATLWHPFRHTPIPLICDESVDMKFSTGAVKITPAHNESDYQIAKRHKLPFIPVIKENGTLCEFLHSPFSGMKRFDAKPAILEELKKQDLFRGHKPHSYNLPICSRSGDVLEYILKPQWFIDCKIMAKKAANALKNGDLEIFPENYQNVYLLWLENIREWNISRQIWWGHQLPFYEVTHINNKSVPIWVVANSKSDALSKSSVILKTRKSELLAKQDCDVLDTWFTSGLFPYSIFGWPLQSENLKKYYPLNVMITGHDILFFWVARMVMLGLQLTGQLPFKKIFLHGIVCDAHGRKMSKSLGNVINPEDIIRGVTLKDLTDKVEENFNFGLISTTERKKALLGLKALLPNGIPNCGADALRFTLVSQNAFRNFVNFDVGDCVKNRAFCNKIWHAFRYVLDKISLLNIDFSEVTYSIDESENLSLMDRWILSKLSFAIELINTNLSNYELNIAASTFNNFFYNEFCSTYIEYTKPIFLENETSEAKLTLKVLLFCLENSLRLMSPFMPYISEELNMWMPKTKYQSIMLAEYPTGLKEFRDIGIEEEIDIILGAINVIRRVKNENEIKSTTVKIVSDKVDIFRKYNFLLKAITKDNYIINHESNTNDDDTKYSIDIYKYNTYIHILRQGKVTISEKQKEKLLIREAKILKLLKNLDIIMENPRYKLRAPESVKTADTEKRQFLKEELNQIQKRLELVEALAKTEVS